MQHEPETFENYSEALPNERELQRLVSSLDTVRDVLGGFGLTLPTLEELERICTLLRIADAQVPEDSDSSGGGERAVRTAVRMHVLDSSGKVIVGDCPDHGHIGKHRELSHQAGATSFRHQQPNGCRDPLHHRRIFPDRLRQAATHWI